MIGNKLSKTKKQKGQVLLLVIMLISTALTVILASSFQSITETQTTKLEEESQKALAAAEAGLEAALKQGTIANIGSLPGLTEFSGKATIETAQSTNFITPLLQKDEQYTLYLSTPQGAPDNPDFSNLTNPYFSGNLTVCFNNVALEITIIKSDNSISRYAINPLVIWGFRKFWGPDGGFFEPTPTPEPLIIIQNGSTANWVNNSNKCPNKSFNNYYDLSINSTKLLIVRVIGNGSTKIGFKGSADLPLQGKTIVSQATSPGGATKKVTLFQSYPQIPAEFFVTGF